MVGGQGAGKLVACTGFSVGFLSCVVVLDIELRIDNSSSLNSPAIGFVETGRLDAKHMLMPFTIPILQGTVKRNLGDERDPQLITLPPNLL